MADNANKASKIANNTVGASVRVRRARVATSTNGIQGSVVLLGAEDFAQLEECTTQQRGPNEAMARAAQLHRRLTSLG